jgi:two-component system sensor histidine kinase RegB
MASSSTNRENIRILNRVRLVALLGQTAMITFAIFYLDIRFPVIELSLIIGFELLLQFYCIQMVNGDRRFGHLPLAAQIALDSLILAALVYYTGGANNPFTYLLLLYVALGSFMLKPRFLLMISALELALYSLLNLYQRPLELGEASPLGSFHLHLAGMWVNFVLSVVLIAVFGLLTRYAMLRQEKQLQLLREKQLQDEQILGLGIMAASAAHELGTPLSTMAIVIDDLKQMALSDEVKSDMTLLSGQISACKKIIRGLQDKSQNAKRQLLQDEQIAKNELDPSQPTNSIAQQLEGVAENWLVYRPSIKLIKEWKKQPSDEPYRISISLEQALMNLMDNAADASVENGYHKIKMVVDCDDNNTVIEIIDYGKGLAKDGTDSLGSKIQDSDKANGLGWGMFLSNVSIERIGGSIEISRSPQDETITRVTLPNVSGVND